MCIFLVRKVMATNCVSPCNPPCDKCCTSCSDSIDNSFWVRQLPYHYSTPASSCNDSMSTVVTIRELPFWVQKKDSGILKKYNQIPVFVEHNYCKNEKICD